MTETLEHTARRIAEQGREALLARLRPAFEQAAAAHRDALSLDDEQLEQMVQKAADRADGLQWRRALASVATDQLGIGLGEALSHPAVARAQAIVGAPSYEEALSALGAEPPKAAADPQPHAEGAGEEPQQPAAEEFDDPDDDDFEEDEEDEIGDDEDDRVHGDEDEPHGERRPAPDATARHVVAAPPGATRDLDAEDAGEHDSDGVRLRAIHLGGIANLAPAEGDLELHISSEGLDIIRGPEHSVLGRLTWAEIVALETPSLGGRFRRKRQTDAHLVVRSEQGSASFEIPGVTTDELREHLDPLLAQR